MKKQAAFLAVALQALGNVGTRGGRPPWVSNPSPNRGTSQSHLAKLEPIRCAYCKEEEHWKRECPAHPQRRKESEDPNSLWLLQIEGDD